MSSKKFNPAVLFVSFFMVWPLFAQTSTVSESVPYHPRESQKAGEKKKNAPAVSTPMVPPAIAGADQVITVPVSVFDKNGQFVQGLERSDFSLFVDNQEVAVTSFEIISQPVNVVLFIDTSPSTQNRLDALQKLAASVVEQLGPDTSVTVVEFNSSMTVLSDLTTDRAETRKGIRKTKMADGTSLYTAVQVLFQKILPKINGRKVVFLFTDGVDTTSRSANYFTSLAEAEKSDVTFFPVYIDTFVDMQNGYAGGKGVLSAELLRQLQTRMGPPFNSKKDYEIGKLYLADLASLSGGRAINVKDIQSRKETNIREDLQLQYRLTFTSPAGSLVNPRRQLRVRINRPNLNVRARGNFVEPKI